MDRKTEDNLYSDNISKSDLESKSTTKLEKSSNNMNEAQEESGEEKREDEEDEEEEEEEEEDRIIEKSPNLRFQKRNKKYMRKVPGIDNSYIAIEPKSGKEVIWNEVNLSDKKSEQENRFMTFIKKLKRYNHPFFVRYLDFWMSKGETNRKIVFVTERLTDPTMKQYFVNSSSSLRLPNKVLWRKFVSQLMSVLKFLNNLGVNHGNLSNETVYYQNTGSLKVGTLAVDLSGECKSSTDIYDLGKLVLEMAAYETLDDVENLSVKDRIQRMQSRITDPLQSSFIETCLDSLETPVTTSKLFQHLVLKEVPSLKRLSAKVIVGHFYSKENKEDKTENSVITTISNNLKEQVSHFEDETVLFKVVFKKENINKSKLWKEFRVNFANLTKYIEDVKNGFYPIFQMKGSATYEETEEITYSISIEQDNLKDIPTITNKESNSSIVVDFNEKEATKAMDSIPEKQDSKLEDAAKEPNTIKEFEPTSHSSEKQLLDKMTGSSMNSKSIANTNDTKPNHNSETIKVTKNSDEKNDVSESGLKIPTKALDLYDENEEDEDEDYDEDEDDRGSGIGNERNTGVASSSSSHVNIGQASVGGGANSSDGMLSGSGGLGQSIQGTNPGTTVNSLGASVPTLGGNNPGIFMHTGNHVNAPDKAPADSSLFTGCQFSYLGCGRWQIYVQMWFVDDRLKREVVFQLAEYDWNNEERIAKIFKNGFIIPIVDGLILEKLLCLARKNISLIEGKIVPSMKTIGHFSAYDLYQRLEHLQLCAKARYLLEKSEEKIFNNSINSSLHNQPQQPQNIKLPQSQMSVHTHAPSSSSPPTVPITSAVQIGASSDESPAANHVPDPSQCHTSVNVSATPADPCYLPPAGGGSRTQHPVSEAPKQKHPTQRPCSNKPIEERANVLKRFKVCDIPGLKLDSLDIRVLAPHNYSCMYCDNHDYLHNENLPPYLSSPCYHCREYFAKEAKLTPQTFFNLHQQNLIPWPAFLQVRYSIPLVKEESASRKESSGKLTPNRSKNSKNEKKSAKTDDDSDDKLEGLWYKTLDELIAYDCKWRGRFPCKCIPNKTLPPCVEFPNLYDSSINNSINPDNPSRNDVSTQLPCSKRHLRGAAMTCIHGYTFPRLNTVQTHKQTPANNSSQQYRHANNHVAESSDHILANKTEDTSVVVPNNPTVDSHFGDYLPNQVDSTTSTTITNNRSSSKSPPS